MAGSFAPAFTGGQQPIYSNTSLPHLPGDLSPYGRFQLQICGQPLSCNSSLDHLEPLASPVFRLPELPDALMGSITGPRAPISPRANTTLNVIATITLHLILKQTTYIYNSIGFHFLSPASSSCHDQSRVVVRARLQVSTPRLPILKNYQNAGCEGRLLARGDRGNNIFTQTQPNPCETLSG